MAWPDARLSDRFRLIAPDHLGYGRTRPYPGGMPLMEHEQAIIGALIELVGEPVHLVGHSFGGAVLARVAVQTPSRVRTLTVVEPTMFHLLAPAGRTAEYQEIRGVADRVIAYVDAGDPQEAAHGFVDYWVGPGAFNAMDPRVRDTVILGMSKLRDEWPTAFESGERPVKLWRRCGMPTLLMVGADTTRAARAVVEVLQGIWPHARYAEIAHAGHMAPVTQADVVNPVIEEFLTQARPS